MVVTRQPHRAHLCGEEWQTDEPNQLNRHLTTDLLRSMQRSGINVGMETVFTFRGRRVTKTDVELIRELIASKPQASRRALSIKLCQAWGWMQANGTYRDAVCRSLLLELHRAGQIELPPARWVASHPAARRRARAVVEADSSPIRCRLSELGPVRFLQVRRTDEEALVEHLIESHHYLGYSRPVGEALKFLVVAGERPLACFVWSSAPRHLGPRDRFIGWSADLRRRNIRFVAYNSRFLILPWVEVPNLASHLLGRMTRMLPEQWQLVYGHPVWYAETFVDPSRFRGTCYRAASWVDLGYTTGRGKDAPTMKPTRPKKQVLGLALDRRFRSLLGGA